MKLLFILVQVALFLVTLTVAVPNPKPGLLSYLETKLPSLFNRAKNVEKEAARKVTTEIAASSAGSTSPRRAVNAAISSPKSPATLGRQATADLQKQHLRNMQALGDANAQYQNALKKLTSYKWHSRSDKRITPALIAKLEREADLAKQSVDLARVNLESTSKRFESIASSRSSRSG